MYTRFLWENLEQRHHLENLNEDGNTTLKLIKTEVGTYTTIGRGIDLLSPYL